jgi:hypothetical protein
MNLPADYTVTDVSRILRRGRRSILLLIEQGYLQAYDAAPGSVRRSYRVSVASLESFMRPRVERVERVKLRTRKTATDMKKFY